MRTTLNLPDALMDRLRAHARDHGQTVTSVVETALLEALDRAVQDDADLSGALVDFPVLGVAGQSPLLDLADPHRLLDALDRAPAEPGGTAAVPTIDRESARP